MWAGRASSSSCIAAQKPTNTQTDNYSTEIDSNGNEDALPRQNYRLANFTFIDTSTRDQRRDPHPRRRRRDAWSTASSRRPTPCLNIVAGETSATDKSTVRPANAALQDDGPPVFNSIFFACTGSLSTATTVNGITVTTAEQDALVAAGTNNIATGTAANALRTAIFPTGDDAAVTPFNAATLNPSGSAFFVQTSYIGAVSGAERHLVPRLDLQFATARTSARTSGACTGLPS